VRPSAALGLPPEIRGTVCTVGTFDGVHRGHRLVLERLGARARSLGLPAVLVTFDPHPLEVVNPAAAPPLLTVGSEKQEVLAESPLDYVVVVPFTPSLAGYGASEFVDLVLRERFGLRELLVGYDHGFGSRGQRTASADPTARAEWSSRGPVVGGSSAIAPSTSPFHQRGSSCRRRVYTRCGSRHPSDRSAG
jgi:FAD synthase